MMKSEAPCCLVATNDSSLSGLLEDLLHSKGYSVLSCSKQAQILESLRSNSIALLVLSEELSDCDGYRVLKRVRDEKFGGAVVFISQPLEDSSTYSKLKGELGVSLVLHPPLDPNLVDLQFGIFLSRKSPASEPAVKNADLTDKIEQMRFNYANILPVRASRLEQKTTEAHLHCQSGSLTDMNIALKESLRLSHNLKGSGETYGFSELSRQAAALESLLKPHVNCLEGPDQDFWLSAFSTLSNLTELASEARGSLNNGGRERDSAIVGPLILLVAQVPGQKGIKTVPANLLILENLAQARETLEKRLDIDAILISTDTVGLEECLAFVREVRDHDELEGMPFGFILNGSILKTRTEATHAGVSIVIDSSCEDKVLIDAIDYLVAVRPDGRSRVLVVDDDEDFLDLVSGVLRLEGFFVKVLQDPTRAVDEMQSWVPDLVMLDVNMPFLSGFELCKVIRGEPRWKDIPILFLTAQTDMQSRIAAYESGGDDYLPKPVALPELIARVKVRLDKARLLKKSMQLDPLTGLLLRAPLLEKLDIFKQYCLRHRKVFSLALIDLDNFKSINDNHGHLVGDHVLRTFARSAKARFRAEDLRGRWGGEEFLFAFPGEDREAVKAILERFLEEFKQVPFKNELGDEFFASFSAGAAEFPGDSQKISDLIKIADGRLYEAKARGRARVCAHALAEELH